LDDFYAHYLIPGAMQKDLKFHVCFHQLFYSLLDKKRLDRNESLMEILPMEVKYILIRLAGLGVVVFTAEHIVLVDGMESWVRLYWEELSQAA